MRNEIMHGDSLDVLKGFPDESIDATVTDPPYGLGTKEPTGEEIDAYMAGALSLGPLKKGRKNCANSILRAAVVPESNDLDPKIRDSEVTFKVVAHAGLLMAGGVIQLDDEIQCREEEIHNIRSVGKVKDFLVGELNPQLGELSGNSKLCLRERQAFTGCVEACRCFATVGPTSFSMVVRFVNNPSRNPEGPSSVVTKGATEVNAVLTLDVRLRTGELHLADSANEVDSGFLLSPPENIGTDTGAGSLLSSLQVLLTSQVSLGTDRTIPFEVTLPATLLDRFHSPRVAQKDFMDKDWEIPSVALWREVYRVMKSGKILMAFAGPRTLDLMTAGIKAAGFSYIGLLQWQYGSGFPKSMDIAKQIDKTAGHWRDKAGAALSENDSMSAPNYERTPKGEAITHEAKTWEGWGTTLKPAWEPVLVFSKGPTEWTMPAVPFLYCAKASKGETSVQGEVENDHPTKKALDVMYWLVRLAAASGELVLDPFLGSGTTAAACAQAGRDFVGIERDDKYIEIARKRVGLVQVEANPLRTQAELTGDFFEMESEDAWSLPFVAKK